MLETGYFSLLNTVPADDLIPDVARASAGMVLTKDRQHVGLLHYEFGLLTSHESWVVSNRYSRLLFTSEDHLCANLRVQEQ